jgi:plasmid stabilization system protein ParE
MRINCRGSERDFPTPWKRPSTASLRGPTRYAIKFRDVRRALVRTFPYAVYFRLREDGLQIVAVLHQHRDHAHLARRVN